MIDICGNSTVVFKPHIFLNFKTFSKHFENGKLFALCALRTWKTGTVQNLKEGIKYNSLKIRQFILDACFV